MTGKQIVLFVVLLLVALVLFMPLSMALSVTGLNDRGLTARSASGTIWSGKLADARIGRLNLGDLSVGLEPLPLFIGRRRVALESMTGKGAMTSTGDGMWIDDTTAKLSTARLFAPVPLDAVDMTAVTVHFASGKCAKAEGRVRATFTGDVGGLSLAQGLSGEARCEGGTLLLPLMSQSTMERLNLHIEGNGDYRAEFVIRSTDPAMAAKLGSAGFRATQAGFVMRLSGKL